MVIWQIDDDPLHLELASLMMRRANPENRVISFESARKALGKLKEEQPDLIVLDINMPDMNGWDFLDEISKQPGPQVVILTSSIDPRDRERAFSYSNVKDFLVKPVRQADLIVIAI